MQEQSKTILTKIQESPPLHPQDIYEEILRKFRYGIDLTLDYLSISENKIPEDLNCQTKLKDALIAEITQTNLVSQDPWGKS